MKKRIVSVLLLLAVFMGYVPASAATATEKNITAGATLNSTVIVSNPLYADIAEDAAIQGEVSSASLLHSSNAIATLANESSTDPYTQVADAAAFVRSQMANRQESIVLRYRNVSNTDEKYDIVQDILNQALQETDNLNQGDYLRWQYGQYSCDIQGYWYTNDDGTRTYSYKFIYTFTYYTTAAQERELNNQISTVMDNLDLDGDTDYQKIQKIYQYVCDHVTFDTSNQNDGTTGRYTAYQAMMKGSAVCQGYSLLLYRMLREAGFSTRIIAGVSEESGEDHSWNIVRIGDWYYYLDSTWDAGKSHQGYDYFLRGADGFLGHEAMGEYTTQEFQGMYPIAAHTYEPSTTDLGGVLGQGTCGENITWSLLDEGLLKLRGVGSMDDYDAGEAPWVPFRGQITSIDIGDGITSIGANAFQGCTALTNPVVLPSSIIQIGASAFADDTALPSVDIMDNVTKISKVAFSKCGDQFVIRGCAGSEAETVAASVGIPFETVQDMADMLLFLQEDTYTYTGGAYTPYVAVLLQDGTQIMDYTISYDNNINAGTATATVCGYGNYGGKASITFVIEKAIPSITTIPQLEALRGQSLQDILLSCEFSWLDPSQSVGMETGSHAFWMTYTPVDATNYQAVDFSMDVMVYDTIGISYEQVKTYVGAEFRLIAATMPNNGARETLTWSSSNSSVASVSSEGAVSALAQGTAVITAMSTNGEYARCTVTVGTLPFTDVSSSEWYYNAVSYAYGTELFSGVRSDSFAPRNMMTRAMLVQVLYNLEGKPTVTSQSSFSDVSAGAWYTDAIIWAAENGIVSGVGHGKFLPSGDVTRQQAAQILYNYTQEKKYWSTDSDDLSAFGDSNKVSSWALSAMQWAVGNELISGTTGKRLNPTGSATRGEVAQIMMQFDYNIIYG